jgi:hypothetical protein
MLAPAARIHPDARLTPMHPKKSEMLRMLDESSRSLDSLLGQVTGIARRPATYGWGSVGAVLALLPLGFSAVLLDVTEVRVARSSDAEWERNFPTTDTNDGPR